MAGKGGGAWKVAYADFVTAMMAFFLVMWLVGQSKPMRESVAQYFRDPKGLSGRPGGPNSVKVDHSGGSKKGGESKKGNGRGVDEPGTTPLNSPEKEGDDVNKRKLLVIHDGNKLTAGSQIPFPENAAELSPHAKRLLEEICKELLGKPNKIELRGHAVRQRPAEDDKYKSPWELSYARSLAVMEYLVEHGIEPRRIRLSQAGTYEPKTLDLNADIATINSRVEIYVLGEFAEELQGTRKERANRNQPTPAKSAGATTAAAAAHGH